MNSKTTVIDMNKDEIVEKFKKHCDNLDAYNFTNDGWNQIQLIKDKYISLLNESEIPFKTYQEAMKELNSVHSLNDKGKFKAQILFDNIMNALSKVGKKVSGVFNSIKFVFSIPALTIASVVFTFAIHLILGLFLYAILPSFIDDVIVKSVISAIAFIVFKVVVFKDLLIRDLKFDENNYLIQFLITIPFWALIFIIFKDINTSPFLQNMTSILSPHMWLSWFTKEYVISPMIALFINCLIAILICFRMAKLFTKHK